MESEYHLDAYYGIHFSASQFEKIIPVLKNTKYEKLLEPHHFVLIDDCQLFLTRISNNIDSPGVISSERMHVIGEINNCIYKCKLDLQISDCKSMENVRYNHGEINVLADLQQFLMINLPTMQLSFGWGYYCVNN